MFWTKYKVSTRKVNLSLAVLCLTAVGMIASAQFNSADASTSVSTSTVAAPAAVFPADAGSLGAIPDGTVGGNICGDFATTNRDVTFNVTGIAAPITDVRLNVSITHTWVGDLRVVLLAPGAAASHTIFSQTSATTATACGDDSNLAGPYNFFDTAPAAPTWWGHAATSTTTMAAGSFRTSSPGGVAGGGANTLMTPAFAGLTTGQANGTWTLRVTDGGEGDVGSVTAASLTVEGGVAPLAGDAPVDFNADGRTDYSVVRNVGGGPSGQIRWYYNLSSGGPTVALDWGLAGDFFVPEDYDNDNKDDIAVWRPGAATVAAFYILNSATNTARVEAFGQTGDDPTVVDDYNNDGSADLAVYRAAATAGVTSTWFYRTTPGGPVTYVPWGQSTDFPAPGDYDGDGSADFVVQRSNGGGQGAFWRNLTTAPDDIVIFGTPTDVIVPGDYDGDGKTDIATVRGIGGQVVWFWEPSSVPGVTVNQFAFGDSATDTLVQGDYDGDGETDAAIWRAGTFWVRSTTTSAVSAFALGAAGDYPVANYNTH